jgi:hypothetical protein
MQLCEAQNIQLKVATLFRPFRNWEVTLVGDAIAGELRALLMIGLSESLGRER